MNPGQVRDREDRCAMNCTENYMKASKVMGDAFTENHPAANPDKDRL